MKKFIILASLAIAVFSIAPYHTVAVPMSPSQTESIDELPPPAPPPIIIVLPPPPPVLLLPPPPPPPEPVPEPVPPPPTEPVSPPPPPSTTTGVPETGATWLLLLLGLAGTFGTMLVQRRSRTDS